LNYSGEGGKQPVVAAISLSTIIKNCRKRLDVLDALIYRCPESLMAGSAMPPTPNLLYAFACLCFQIGTKCLGLSVSGYTPKLHILDGNVRSISKTPTPK